MYDVRKKQKESLHPFSFCRHSSLIFSLVGKKRRCSKALDMIDARVHLQYDKCGVQVCANVSGVLVPLYRSPIRFNSLPSNDSSSLATSNAPRRPLQALATVCLAEDGSTSVGDGGDGFACLPLRLPPSNSCHRNARSTLFCGVAVSALRHLFVVYRSWIVFVSSLRRKQTRRGASGRVRLLNLVDV